MELTLNELKEKGLKCNIEKSLFGHNKMEYLGFWVTRDDIKSRNIKLGAIINMKPPTSQKEARQFICVGKYYRDMWPWRLHTLVPLTKIMSNKKIEMD